MAEPNRTIEDSIFRKTEDSDDFKVFDKIENTFVGVLAFVVGYLRITWWLLSRPWRLDRNVASVTKRRIARPFTYLAVSSFGAYLAVRYQRFDFVFRASVRERTPDISVTEVLGTTFPIMIIVVVAGVLLGFILTSQPPQRRRVLDSVCYVFGYQFLVVFVISVASATYYSFYPPQNDQFLDDVFNSLELGLKWTLLFGYLVIMGGLALWPAVKRELPKWSRGARRFATIAALLVFCAITLTASLAPARLPEDFDYIGLIAKKPSPVLHCEPLDAQFDKQQGRLQFDVIVSLTGVKSDYVVRRTSPRVGVRFQTFEQSSNQLTEHIELGKNAVIIDWSAGDGPVMFMRPATPQWATITFDAPEQFMSKHVVTPILISLSFDSDAGFDSCEGGRLSRLDSK